MRPFRVLRGEQAVERRPEGVQGERLGQVAGDAELAQAGRTDRHRAGDDHRRSSGGVEGLAPEDRPARLAGQVDVEQDEVRPEALGRGASRRSRPSGDRHAVAAGAEVRRQQAGERLVVLDDQDVRAAGADHAAPRAADAHVAVSRRRPTGLEDDAALGGHRPDDLDDRVAQAQADDHRRRRAAARRRGPPRS